MTSSLRATARRFANRDAWTEGRAWFEERLVDAESRAHLAFFVAKESRYDTDRAFALLAESLSLDPACALAWVYRAMILGTLLRSDEAADALERAAALGALEEDLVRTRAWIALDAWRLDDAIEGFARLVEICPESSSCVLLATAHLQAGQYEDAVVWARRALEREADDFRGHAYAGVALTYMGRFRDAREELLAAARLAPGSPMVHHALGYAALQAGDEAAAERHLRDAVRVDPLYVTSQKLLADLCARSGRAGEARTRYLAALTLFPDYPAAREGLARLEG
jgi:Flp pilus assembly protein TadD